MTKQSAIIKRIFVVFLFLFTFIILDALLEPSVGTESSWDLRMVFAELLFETIEIILAWVTNMTEIGIKY